jgi:hypothetical protein
LPVFIVLIAVVGGMVRILREYEVVREER